MTHRFEISTAAGLSAHTEARMSEMLRNDEDFQDFKQIAEDGFGHIRIPMDPVAMGLYENALFPDLVPSDAPIFRALYQDILDAQDAGLMVVLDFHPVIVSQQHWQLKVGTPIPQGKEYTGRYLYHYLDGVGSPNHPLARVWQSFTTGLDAYFASQGKPAPTNTVVMEILNEPFETIAPRNSEFALSLYLPPHLLALDPREDPPPTVPTHIGWRVTQIREFRNIMKHGALAVRSVNPNYRVIVSQHVQLPYGPDHPETNAATTAPYTTSEFPDHSKLIYAWHLYEPMKFTHPSLPYTTYNFERDFTGTVPGTIYFCYALNQVTPTPAIIANNVIHAWTENHKDVIGYYPQMMFTEFGAEHTLGGLYDSSNNDDPSPQADPLFQRPLQRIQWYYDTRTYIEGKIENSGWSAYEYLGGMALYRGFPGQPALMYHPNNYNLHGYRGILKPNIKQALFGVTRPTQAD